MLPHPGSLRSSVPGLFGLIKEDGPGLAGDEGSKFPKFAEFLSSLEQELSQWHFDLLCENVVMQKSNEVQFVSEGLRAQPIIVDAADLGLVNRPRMWWLRVNWKQVRKNPFTDQALRWGSLQKMPRLYMDFPWLESSDLELEGCRLPGRVEKHECRLPCMTTPAPTSEGRPPPKKMRSRMRPDNSRQLAPWHYDEEHMLLDASGNLCLPSVTLKEQLQGLPIGYTGVGDITTRSRPRMLGNAWNCTVAKFLLTFILLFGHPEGTTSCRSIPPTPRQSALQLMLSLAQSEHHGMGPVETTYSELAMQPVPVMVDDHHEETQRWFGQLPHHIQHVYSQTNGYITQLPILVQLLKACNFPELQHLEADLCEGFPLTGAQNHGPGWVAISLILSPLTPSSSSTVSTFGRSWLESLLTLTGKHY